MAVIRDGEAITDFDPAAFEFRECGEVIVAGTDDSITEFGRQFGG